MEIFKNKHLETTIITPASGSPSLKLYKHDYVDDPNDDELPATIRKTPIKIIGINEIEEEFTLSNGQKIKLNQLPELLQLITDFIVDKEKEETGQL